MSEILPFKSNFIEIAGYKMHYLDEGQGPAILFLHGNPTWCYYYRNIIAELKANFRCIAPDYIGCGLSDHPQKIKLRARDRITHLQEFISKLGIDKFSLVMHDWGGSIGSGLAVSMPEKIDRLVYLNTTLTETESLPFVIKLAATPFIGRFFTQSTKTFLRLTTGPGVVKKLPKEVKAGYMHPYKTRRDREAIWNFVDDIPFDSSHPSYSEMLNLAVKTPLLADKPVQIIWGLKDPCFHKEMLSKVAVHFPQAQILEIPDAGHLVLEDARQLANETIKSFFVSSPNTFKTKEHLVSKHSLVASFFEQADHAPQLDAVIEPISFVEPLTYQRTSFGELKTLVHKYERGLVELGLRAGEKVVMLVSPGVEFIALSYAVMSRGGIPVFLDPGMGKDNLVKCILETRPVALIGSWKAHILAYLKRKVFSGIKFKVFAHNIFGFWGNNLGFLKRFSASPLSPAKMSETGLIAFTSGGTGTPKGVIFTQEMLKAQLKIFSEELGLKSGSKDLPMLPIFSLYSIALGVASVFPPVNPAKPISFDPTKIVQIINALSVDTSFGSPTLWGKIYEYCLRSRNTLPSVKKVFLAGAAVSEDILKSVKNILPNGEAYSAYGATEALPVSLISSRDLISKHEKANSGEQGTCVGQHLKEVSIKIIESSEGIFSNLSETREVPAGAIGEIIVKGENISPSYLERDQATKQAKISDGDSFWHRLGDMGYLDSAGNLYFCGRVVHVVKSKEKIFHSVPVEDVFNAHSKVKRSALVDLNRQGEPAIVIEPHPQFWPETPEAQNSFREEIRSIAKDNSLTSEIEKIFFHQSFPVDARHNAKIFRDKLGEWASKQS